jgi:hypothetical protein
MNQLFLKNMYFCFPQQVTLGVIFDSESSLNIFICHFSKIAW